MSYQAVIFDMDGTLIDASIDFKRIRSELGISAESGILEALEELNEQEKRGANKILMEYELESAMRAKPMTGAEEVVERLRSENIKTGLLTRNNKSAMEIVLRNVPSFRFDAVASRDCGPVKPNPQSIVKLCERMQISASQCICVGDYYYDIRSANQAGAVSVLYAPRDIPSYANTADYVIKELTQILEIVGLRHKERD